MEEGALVINRQPKCICTFGLFDELHMGSCPLYGGSLGISRKPECVSTFVICVLYFKSQRMQMAN